MGVKLRGLGRYLYRSVREGRRVRSVYFGLANEISLAAYESVMEPGRMLRHQKREAREAREAEARARRELEAEGRRARSAVSERSADLTRYCRKVDRAVAAALEAIGIRRHNRGEWRRARGMAGTMLERSRVRELIELAKEGDRLALGEVSERAPWWIRETVCEGRGDLDEIAEGVMIKGALRSTSDGFGRLHRDAIEARMEEIRRQLAPIDAGPVVELLATRAALNWLHLHRVEQELVHVWNAQAFEPKAAQALERLLSQATARYERSLLAVAKARRLELPVIIGQVNVAFDGGRQVNQAAAVRK